MFQFAFDGELFTLQYRAPALRPLFTLPPTSSARKQKARTDHRHLHVQSEKVLYGRFAGVCTPDPP